ncbi:MAG TPA: iron ABC transporter permease [Spirochaetota bacterium]|nr:iron ABC transporter permease [Spirochaetota bacterium]
MNKRLRLSALLILPLVALTAGLSLGSEAVSPLEIFSCMPGGDCTLRAEVVLKLRLPRVIIAMFAGAALSVSGAAFQSVFRNPLADPFITGVSGGAALGISAAVITGMGPAAVMAMAFGGSLLAIVMIYAFSAVRGITGSGLVLSGVALSFIFSSSVMLIFAMARSEDVHRIIIWLMGDLSYQGNIPVTWICLSILAAMFILFMFHRHLDIISMGRGFSLSSGVSDFELRVVILLASVLAALAVLLGGIIPFVGLMVPHLARMVAGPDHYRLVPLSAVAGGSFLVLADAFSRSVIVPYEIPAGVVTGFCGGIFFLLYVIKNRPEI